MPENRFTIMSEGSPLKDVVLRALQATGEWSVPAMRQPGFELIEQIMQENGFRAAAGPLPANANVLFDNTVVQVGTSRLTFVADLLSEGLIYPLPDPLSVTALEWTLGGRVGAAKRTMTPSARGENKLPAQLTRRLPVYLTTDNFELDIRTLRMSQRVGVPLDTNLVAQCTRSVNEAIEDAGINGATTIDGQQLAVASYTAPGLLNAPNANTVSLSVDWTAPWASTTGPAIVADVMKMIAANQADKKFGPYNLYTSSAAGLTLGGDYQTQGTTTIQQRIESITAGGRPIRVRPADMFPAATTGAQAALVQMTSDVVDVVDGQRPTVIP